MPWKTAEGGGLALSGDHPIFVADGKEFVIDGEQVLGKISELTKEAEKRRLALDAATERFKPYESLVGEDGKPLDPGEIRKALDTVKALSTKKLMEADEANAVMAAAVEKALGQAKTEISTRDASIKELTDKLIQKEKAWAFGNSKFVSDRMSIKAPQALRLYGDAFNVEGEQLVGYHKGEKIMSRKTFGEVAGFEEAMEIIVEADPYKDSVLKSEAGGGSGAAHSTNNGGGSGGKKISRSAFKAMDPTAQMKFMKDGGALLDSAP